jgi:hypothetical protein
LAEFMSREAGSPWLFSVIEGTEDSPVKVPLGAVI